MSHRLGTLISLSLLLLVSFLLFSAACTPGDPQSTFDAAGEVSRSQLNLFYIIFWAAVFVFVAVEGLLIYAVIRFRRKPGQGDPEQVHGNRRLEIAWTVAPAIVLAVIAVPTIITILDLSSPPKGESINVNVIAHQWWWEFEYPDLNIVTANELHIPVGKVVNIKLESNDVIHSFWVPKLAGKQDVVPNNINEIWLNADEPGVYFGQCAEFCGVAHAYMRFRVIAEPQEEFDRWAEDFLRPAMQPKGVAIDGAALFTQKGCIACHTIQDNPIARGTIGPDLTHFGIRTTLAAGVLEKDRFGENLTRWLRDPDDVKPGNIMARDAPVYQNPELALSNFDIAALGVYLRGLKPDLGAEPTVTPPPPPPPSCSPPLLSLVPGDPEAGNELFVSQGCSACHLLGEDRVIGPGLADIDTRAATRVEDLTAEQYICQSIVDPGAYVVEGFPNAMPGTFGDVLSEQGIRDLIAYLLTLK